jgi:hypothetical protein
MARRHRQRREDRRRHSSNSGLRVRDGVITGAGLTAGAVLGMGGVAHAADFPVTNLSDGAAPGPDGSLRKAITDANANSGPDNIVFDSSLSGTILLNQASIPITEALTISGPGADVLTVDAYYGTGRIFTVDPTVAGQPVSISGLTLAYGFTTASGGAIFNADAKLTVSGSLLFGNSSSTDQIGGGAIADAGAYANGSQTTIVDSTITGNSAINGFAGGVGGGMQIGNVVNSTISGNYAYQDGGGLFSNDDGGNFQNSTVAGNYAYGSGGGIANGTGGATTAIENSIVGDNFAGSANPDLLGANTFDAEFSLLENISGVTINSTVTGSNISGTDPALPAYAYFDGGTTPTMVPAPNSPVIDKGKTAAAVSADQRGEPRPFDVPAIPNSAATGADGADMGAVETTLDEATPVDLALGITDSADPATVGTPLDLAFQVTNNGPNNGTSIDLSVFIPAELQYNDGSSDPACDVSDSSISGSTVTCGFGGMTSGQSATKNLAVTPLPGAAAYGYVSTYGYVGGAQGDPNQSNNFDYEDTTVVIPTVPPGTGPPTPSTSPSTFNLAAAVKRCKKKFRKGPKRKKCIKKARRKAATAATARGGAGLPQHPFISRKRPPALERLSLQAKRRIWGMR